MGKRRTTTVQLAIHLISAAVLILAFTPEPTQAAGICGTGTWTSGNLEIHHINIGQGDATLIVGPTGRSLLFDAGETNWNSSAKAQIIGPYIEAVLGCKSLDYVVVSHFHLDHVGYVGYGGLWHLVETQGFAVGAALVRDYNNYLGDISGTFTNWKSYLEGAGQTKLHPATAVEGTGQVNLGTGVAFNIVSVDGNGALIAGDFSGDSSPPSENDYSIGAVLSYGDFDEWIGGDLDGQYQTGGFGYTYHDIELSVALEVGDVDVYKANHHGSSHSTSATFLNQLDPEVSIVTVGNGNTYGHPAQVIMDRLLGTSTVYLTERGNTDTNIGSAIVAGSIVIKTSDGFNYTVNGTAFTATEPVRTDVDGDGYFLEADPDDTNLSLGPAPNGGCGPIYQTCSVSCQATVGQVLINEVFPSPSSGPEWVELYNATANTINIGYCYIDDIAAGSTAYQIPGSTLIPPHGFWTLDRTAYFNNTGDEVRFLKEDAATLLDSFSYGNTGSDLSWYRFPDGGSWAMSSTAITTKGQSNTLPYHPIVSSIVRADENPTDAATVNFTVTFSKAVTGVNTIAPFQDFLLTNTGITGASIIGVNGSGSTYTVGVNTGLGAGTLRLDVVDDDSIRDASNHPLGGAGVGNGSFTSGEFYAIEKLSTRPGKVSQIGPAGSISTTRPTFTWNVAPDTNTTDPATWYYLWVNGPSGNVLKRWYPASTVCTGSACSVMPDNTLSSGAHIWWIQTWNEAGYGPWSSAMNFSITPPPPPGKASLVSPNGLLSDTTPEYVWNKVPDAEWYFLWVKRPSGKPVKIWFNAAGVCGDSICQVAPAQRLGAGIHTWWIQTWNASGGYGAWSNGMNFTVTAPGQAMLVSPSGAIVDTRPTYTWNKVEGADWYYLWVNVPSGNGIVKQWFEASAICGVSTCSATPPKMLSSGDHTWWIRTWNSAGYGPWSSAANFTLP